MSVVRCRHGTYRACILGSGTEDELGGRFRARARHIHPVELFRLALQPYLEALPRARQHRNRFEGVIRLQVDHGQLAAPGPLQPDPHRDDPEAQPHASEVRRARARELLQGAAPLLLLARRDGPHERDLRQYPRTVAFLRSHGFSLMFWLPPRVEVASIVTT